MNDAIREKLKSLPEKPGCYIMRDRKGRIIYVGKAVDLKRRVSSYFNKYTMRRGDPKVRSLVNSAQDIEWIVLKSEDEALLGGVLRNGDLYLLSGGFLMTAEHGDDGLDQRYHARADHDAGGDIGSTKVKAEKLLGIAAEDKTDA